MLDKFDLHTKIFIGSASFDKMLEQRRRVFIVTDKFMHESGRVSYLTDKIKAEGAKWEIFSDVTPDPDIETVTAGVAKILEFQPETILPIGAGVTIDAAKTIVYFAAKQIDLRDCPFVAVPTTSGTGSEVSKFAVITDRARGIKYPLIDDTLLPDYAVLDAELTCSVPPKVTADTGLDVLTHAIEAFVCTEANAFTDALAEKSVKLVDHYLLLAYKEPDNREARQGMHNASCLAGAAFSNAGLGLCHSMAHAMGAQFHIPHGRANAILLPVVMSFNAGCETTLTPVATRYAELASLIGMGATSMRQSALNLIHMVRRLQQRMGVPQCIKDAGVSAEDFEAALDTMADAALADRCTATNPKPCTKEDIIELYRQAYSKSNRKGLS